MRSLALALAAVLALTTAGWAAPRAAPAIPCNLAIDKLRPDCRGQPGSAANGALKLALKPFQDLVDLVTGDDEGAIALATALPNIKDGNGQQCWIAMRDFGGVIKQHPLPLTLHAMTDLEALRLASIAARRLCDDPHCTTVFADLSVGIQQLAPLNLSIPIPSLHDLCAKVPTIAVVPAVEVPPAPPPPPAPAPPAQ